jgi:hypothetical protein
MTAGKLSYLFIVDGSDDKFYRKSEYGLVEKKTCGECGAETRLDMNEWAEEAGKDLADYIKGTCFSGFTKGLREQLNETA